jgi:hypothetical protein
VPAAALDGSVASVLADFFFELDFDVLAVDEALLLVESEFIAASDFALFLDLLLDDLLSLEAAD